MSRHEILYDWSHNPDGYRAFLEDLMSRRATEPWEVHRLAQRHGGIPVLTESDRAVRARDVGAWQRVVHSVRCRRSRRVHWLWTAAACALSLCLVYGAFALGAWLWGWLHR